MGSLLDTNETAKICTAIGDFGSCLVFRHEFFHIKNLQAKLQCAVLELAHA